MAAAEPRTSAVPADSQTSHRTDVALAGERSSSKVPESCVPDLDALWFCYSPVYQFRYYYMNGTVDSCVGKVRRLVRCFRSRLLSPEDAERLYANGAEDDENAHASAGRRAGPYEPVWELRARGAAPETPGASNAFAATREDRQS
jgi:hypothetical protein